MELTIQLFRLTCEDGVVLFFYLYIILNLNLPNYELDYSY